MPAHAPHHSLMDEDQLGQWVLRRLGAPKVDIELAPEHLEDAIERARRWFSAKKGFKRQFLLQIVSDQVEYPLPEDVDTVTNVSFPGKKLDLSLVFAPTVFSQEEIPYDVFAASGSLGLYSSYLQTLQYVNQATRIIGAEMDWRQEGRLLYIFPGRKQAGTSVVEYKASNFTIEQLNERDHDILKRFALAAAKADLGRIRSKYDGYMTAQGTTNLDGNALLEEAKEEMEALDEELALSAGPMGFMLG